MRPLVLRGANVLENIQIFNRVDRGRSGRRSGGRLGRGVNSPGVSGGSRDRSGSGRHCNGCSKSLVGASRIEMALKCMDDGVRVGERQTGTNQELRDIRGKLLIHNGK
jgi:hypothetical protein